MKPKPFNWFAFLRSAIKKEPTVAQQVRAHILAKEWPTCATGALCRNLPKDRIGAPEDGLLCDLGYLFYIKISNRSWVAALAAMHKIEARTAKLLKRKGKK